MDVREVCNRPPSAERGGLVGIFPPILGCTSTQGDFPSRGCVTDSVHLLPGVTRFDVMAVR